MNIQEFEQKIAQAGKPVVVDFWAEWCVPCRVTKPILEKLAREYADRVEFMPVTADDSHDVLSHYKVFGIPTVLAFRDGKLIGRSMGAQGEMQYRMIFDALVRGDDVKLPIASFDRAIRIGAGLLFALIGVSTGSLWMVALGGLLGFLGVYDRCPVWNALIKMLRHT